MLFYMFISHLDVITGNNLDYLKAPYFELIKTEIKPFEEKDSVVDLYKTFSMKVVNFLMEEGGSKNRHYLLMDVYTNLYYVGYITREDIKTFMVNYTNVPELEKLRDKLMCQTTSMEF